jgi:hypothetical protein
MKKERKKERKKEGTNERKREGKTEIKIFAFQLARSLGQEILPCE